MILTDAQLDRYARHIVLRDIGGAGQAKLLASHVAVIGAGGIGCPAILYLAAAGVGRLTIIDDDAVSLSNLQRQILFTINDIYQSKAIVSEERVAVLNPDVAVRAIAERLTTNNIAATVGDADLILDGTDNFATRLMVSDHATTARIPLVSAAIGQFQGQIGSFRGWLADEPCYRCFVGDAFDNENCDSCSDTGVLGAMAGVMGSWAAMEAIRALAGFGEETGGKLHIFDGLAPSMRTLKITKDPECSGCKNA